MFCNRLVFLFFCVLVSQHGYTQSHSRELVVAVVYSESLPFYSYDAQTQSEQGLYTDILRYIGKSLNLEVRYLPTARNKIDQDILEHKADAGFIAKKWLASPNSFVLSGTVFSYNHAFYGLEQPVSNTDVLANVKGKSVCLRENYRYPELTKWLSAGMISPIYVSSHTRLFELLQQSRCDLIYTNTYRATWTIDSRNDQRHVFYLGGLGEKDEIPLAFSPEWSPKMPEVNAAIAEMHRSGEMQRIINKNVGLVAINAP
ncbi:hypothetical protein FX988_01994 [Paraglaciecola mesophila]|uniref:Solute-binding protein family 3/N-terminal domain-containing protein n=1 Tax=Paraglaciecola mesophila TaxID=197222 RepID=A0A857JKG1_9ALTE|nr:hypothetical protein FX988_01994 [Paraglaciecola mesophila]